VNELLDYSDDDNDSGPVEEANEDDVFQDSKSNDDADDSDNDSDLRNIPNGITGNELVENIVQLWRKHRSSLVTDFAVAGWMLSPLDVVQNDVANNRDGDHNLAVDRVLSKIFHHQTEEELGTNKDRFCTEYQQFSKKSGESFGDARKYIWNSESLQNWSSAIWHSQYSLDFTKVC